MLPLAVPVVEAQRADHRLPPPVLAHQQAGPVQADRYRSGGLLELRQGVTPVLFLGQRRRRHRIGDVLDQAAGQRPAVVLLQVDLDPGRAELGVLVGDDLGEPWGGGDDDPGIPVQGAVGHPALGALVDVAGDGGDAVGGLVVLLDLPLAGEPDRTDGDGGAVGVELLEALGGAEDPGLVEPVLEGLLEVEHGVAVRDLDLEGEWGRRPGDDRGIHGSSPSGEGWKVPQAQGLSLHHFSIKPYSPNLNLIERLWRFVRKQSLDSTYYDGFEQFTAAID